MSSRGEGTLTIGKVIARLHEDFPDLTISKVRFLEAEGLLTPQRTPSGYRLYTLADVDRLAWVLRAQREQFWPLKVIREALDALDRGLTVPGAPGPAGSTRATAPEPEPDAALAPPLAAGPPGARLTGAEIAESAGLAQEEVEALAAAGLLQAEGEWFGDADLAIAHAYAGLLRHGVDLRHLRPLRAAADRLVGLATQAASARRGEDAVAAAGEVLEFTLRLHAGLARRGLRSQGLSP